VGESSRTVFSEISEMMNLEAVCLGYAVPRRGFAAEVHSAFPSAANLRLFRRRLLLTLVTIGEADLPQGIRVDTPEGFSFEELRQGERVTCRNGILHCEQAPLTIDLRPARRWKCDLPALTADMKEPTSLAAWQLVKNMLEERQFTAGNWLTAGFVAATHRISERVPELVEATRRYDLDAAVAAFVALFGLGPGLTPGGDDFLVGFLAGLWCAAGGRTERAQFLSGLGKAVIHLSRRTNDISRTYLVHAARGQVSSCLVALANAICRGDRSDHLIETAVAALQVGHSSGMESVSGLLQGLSVWSGGLTH